MNSLRKYQHDCLEAALHVNTLVFIDTGAGKTRIAFELVKRVEGKAVFLAPQRELVEQQFTAARQAGVHATPVVGNQSKVMDWAFWKRLHAQFKLIVATPDVFRQALGRGAFALSDFALLILDECHHTRKNHPYNRLMEDYYHNLPYEKRPRVLGLTASPVIDRELCPDKLPQQLDELCQRLDCTVAKYDALSLAQVVNKPKYSVVGFDNEQTCTFRDFHGRLVQILRRTEPELSKTVCNNFEMLLSLGTVGFRLYLEYIATEYGTHGAVALRSLQLPQREYSFHFQSLVNALWAHLQTFPEGQAIILVKKRITVIILARLLHHLTRQYQCPFTVTHLIGVVKPSNSSVNMTEQERSTNIQKFRRGEANTLVATSVIEEGIDVPACSLVIRFDAPCDNLRSYVQSRGRARQQDSEFVLLCPWEEEIATIQQLKIFETCIDWLKKYSATNQAHLQRPPVLMKNSPVLAKPVPVAEDTEIEVRELSCLKEIVDSQTQLFLHEVKHTGIGFIAAFQISSAYSFEATTGFYLCKAQLTFEHMHAIQIQAQELACIAQFHHRVLGVLNLELEHTSKGPYFVPLQNNDIDWDAISKFFHGEEWPVTEQSAVYNRNTYELLAVVATEENRSLNRFLGYSAMNVSPVVCKCFPILNSINIFANQVPAREVVIPLSECQTIPLSCGVLYWMLTVPCLLYKLNQYRKANLLARRLEIDFSEQTLAQALTGQSIGELHDNSRLCILGESLLRFLVSYFLYKNFPGFSGSRLFKEATTTVNSQNLYKHARVFEIQKYAFAQAFNFQQWTEYALTGHFKELVAKLTVKEAAQYVYSVTGAAYVTGGMLAARKFLQKLRLICHVRRSPVAHLDISVRRVLNYTFTQPAWLHLALRPPEIDESANNGQLEFLGHALISFVIAEHCFFKQRPDCVLQKLTKEPECSKIFSVVAYEHGLVMAQQKFGYCRDEALAQLLSQKPAQAVGLQWHVFLADSIPAFVSIFKAVIAAIFVDSHSYEEARDRVLYALQALL